VQIVVWNMGNGGPGNSAEKHARTWSYLLDLDFDVALLQETRDPRPDYSAELRSIVWRPKYESRSRRPLWGSAVVARTLELEAYEPADNYPWLNHLRGSTAVARSATEPAWFASVHLHDRRIQQEALAALPWADVPLTTRDKSLWETNVIPHELRHLFADDTFLWGGDLNSAIGMDSKRWFAGGNERLREVWKAGGSVDLRLDFFPAEQRTYFHPSHDHYQLDHVFADATTARRVTSWRVDVDAADCELPYSDHAPVLVELGDAPVPVADQN
jgi:endonuclease/exonuclease/phosphatase family metal-dependent hydrolase